MVCIIHGKKKIRATATASILGINVNVISLMDVAAWKMLTSNPTRLESMGLPPEEVAEGKQHIESRLAIR